jgi:hypothetical protein
VLLPAVLSSSAGAQGLVTEKNIPLAMAQTIANAALAQCYSMGFKVSKSRAGACLQPRSKRSSPPKRSSCLLIELRSVWH